MRFAKVCALHFSVVQNTYQNRIWFGRATYQNEQLKYENTKICWHSVSVARGKTYLYFFITFFFLAVLRSIPAPAYRVQNSQNIDSISLLVSIEFNQLFRFNAKVQKTNKLRAIQNGERPESQLFGFMLS